MQIFHSILLIILAKVNVRQALLYYTEYTKSRGYSLCNNFNTLRAFFDISLGVTLDFPYQISYNSKMYKYIFGNFVKVPRLA